MSKKGSKPRPIEVHVNSMGAKHLKFQEIIHSQGAYWYYPLDGSKKTKLYAKGMLDGKRFSVKIYQEFDEAIEQDSPYILAIPSQFIKNQTSSSTQFFEWLSLENMYLLDSKEAANFINSYCMECEGFGSSCCYQDSGFRCAEEDRDRYSESTWFAVVKERKKQRKSATFKQIV